MFLDFPGGSAGKKYACNAGDLGSIPGLGRSPGEGKGYPLQYSGLENSVDHVVHGVADSETGLRDLHFHFHHGSVGGSREQVPGRAAYAALDHCTPIPAADERSLDTLPKGQESIAMEFG